MAFEQTYLLTPPIKPARKPRDVDALLPLLLLYYGFMPWADVLSGALSNFYEINWFSVAYKAGTMLLLLLFIITARIRTPYAIVAAIVITLLILGAGFRQTLGFGGFKDDLVFIARGPILLSGILVVLLSLSPGNADRVARMFFVSLWVATVVSIFVTSWLGVSLATYDAGYGSRGFYQAANEVTLGFILSWWYMQTRMISSIVQSVPLFLITVYLIYTLGTKSGFVLIPILGLWYVGRILGTGRKLNMTVFALVAGGATAYAGSIFVAVLPYLPAADASTFFINTYGVSTTLTGGRFIDIDDIMQTIGSYSLLELIFGTGFVQFWFLIDGSSVESDLIDTLGGGGILFAGWFYGILLWGYLNSKVRRPDGVKVDTAWAFVFIAVIMYSIFVGHVAFAATPLITVAMYLALAYKERKCEDRGRPLVV